MCFGKRLVHYFKGHNLRQTGKFYRLGFTGSTYEIILEKSYTCTCGEMYTEEIARYCHQRKEELPALLEDLKSRGYVRMNEGDKVPDGL